MVESVYFTSLEFENVRCFGDLQKLNLTDDGRRPARWTIILGENGAGKTTLLQCLAWMRLEPGRFDPSLFNEDNDFLTRLRPMNKLGNLGLTARLSIGRALPSVDAAVEESDSRGRSVTMGLSIDFDSEGELVDKSKNRRGTFEESLVVAYGANRQLGSLNLTTPQLNDPIGTRLHGVTELYDAEQMLRELHYASQTRENPERAERDLNHLKDVIVRILPEDLNPDHIQIHSLDNLGRGEKSGVYLSTFTGSVAFSELSLGYRTTLAWTADFAWRLMRQYPESNDPFAEPAVVLIDEIDLHLHPRWQLSIMRDLSQIFPATQFIATSHSPLMAQVAENENFVLCIKRQEERDVVIENDPNVIRGWRVDQILTSELFGGLGARSPKIEGLFVQRDELLAKPSRTADQEAELESLRAQIAELPTAQFPSDQKAMDSVREAAALLKKHGVGLE